MQQGKSVKTFFKPLALFLLFIFFLAHASHAGPRPGYSAYSSAGRSTMLRSFPGNFTKPNPGGASVLRNYPSVMPAARLAPSFVSSTPYPTNKWHTSLLTDTTGSNATTQSRFGNRIAASPMIAVYSTRYPYVWDEGDGSGWSDGGGFGYSLGGQSIKFSGGNNVYVSNALAIAVQGAKANNTTDRDVIKASNILVKNYSDWSVTAVLKDTADPAKTMTTTFGKGFVFTYNTFSPGVNPRIRTRYVRNEGDVLYYYDNNGVMTNAGSNVTVTTDHIMMRVRINKTDTNPNYAIGTVVNEYQYFGIYAPAGTMFTISPYNWDAWQHMQFLNITFPASATSESDRYLSVALLKSPSASPDDAGAFSLFRDYYSYAYNFITDTQVSWNYDRSRSALTTHYNFTLETKRTGGSFAVNQTLFALYPHQWKNLTGSPLKNNTYNSIRGLLKVSAGNSFSTRHEFNGIIPFLTYELDRGTASDRLQTYIDYDKTFEPSQARIDGGWKGNSNTYYHGKAVARAANLIPVFHQHGDIPARDAMINRLKAELAAWYSGSSLKNFGYDSAWGGIIGSNPGAPSVNDFGASQFNDHHFHYSYFIYASAILAIYDPSFASDSQYKGMVDLLVKEIYNPSRNDPSFPFLRNFDVYEGHSYANGRGGGDFYFGNDEESTSEAMNSWAAVYLWGIVTGNGSLVDLAVYGYTTQYEATKNYYYNIDGDIWSRSYFNHASVGMLFDSAYRWSLWWDPKITQTVMGIQVLPLTPSLLYMGYDTDYARMFYNEMWTGRDQTKNNLWRDIWLRYESLFDAPRALADWDSANLPVNFPDTFNTGIGDDGSSLSFSYHFIHFFNAMGTVDTSYYAGDPSFLVTNKNGERTFFAYNPDKNNYKTVNFYKRAAASAPAVPNGGSMTIPPGMMAQTKDFTQFKYSGTDTSYSANESTNTNRDVYSIYSDNFIGAVVGGNAYQDNLALDAWEATVTFNPEESFLNSFEGKNYLSVTRNNGDWGGWGFRFADGAVNMASYYNGRIEVSIKLGSPSSVAGDFEIGFESIAGQMWFKLSDLGFDQTLTSWQTVSIPLNGASNSMISQTSLSYVTLPFIMRHNAGNAQNQWGIPVYIDSVLWKKADPSAYFTAELKKRGQNLPDSSITWLTSDYRQENAVAQQYIQIGLNYVDGNSWGLQMYTDNKSSVTVAAHVFTGNISTDTASGLVNSRNTSLPMLPMRWRPAPSTIEETEIFLPQWQDPWKFFRDVSAFDDSTGLHSGCDEIKFMDRRGFRYNAADYGSLPDDKKIRLYFIADFTNARRNSLYGANLVIEYFNE